MDNQCSVSVPRSGLKHTLRVSDIQRRILITGNVLMIKLLVYLKCSLLDFRQYVHASNYKLRHGQIDRTVLIYLYVCYANPALALVYWLTK